MNSNVRIQRLIREARVQRSADVGVALGEFLADLWIGTAEMFGKIPAARANRVEKTSTAG